METSSIGLVTEIRKDLVHPNFNSRDPFDLLKSLCVLVNEDAENLEAQELVLRALEKRDQFGNSVDVLDGLVRRVGLYPYLEPVGLPIADQIAYEFHRPINMDDEVVFHRPQAQVYRSLISGESVVLSAPTSFGKSLIIDAVIAASNFDNVVIVVPTIALIDETRRRLTRRFGSKYKVITHPNQKSGPKNLFVLTQERVLEMNPVEKLDFFVLDEFYKLSPKQNEDNRADLLNLALKKLMKMATQFYMLGPGVDNISNEFKINVKFKFVRSKYHTVVSELHFISKKKNSLNGLVKLCETLNEPTIIFCKSPSRAADVARKLVESEVVGDAKGFEAAAEWISNNYHPNWHFAQALSNGIGVHHARIPRALSQYVLRKFNENKLRFLICTSTLIEGVNTKAKNIIILDNTINRNEIDLFTFNNIRGRSGRMFEHFVGHVYVFHNPPDTELPFVDVPAFTQSKDASLSLLIQLEESELTDISRRRVAECLKQKYVSLKTLRQNIGIDPIQQIGLAREIYEEAHALNDALTWTSFPNYEELSKACELIWKHLKKGRIGGSSVLSARQLTFMISRLRKTRTVKEAIRQQVANNENADKAVDNTLSFIRLWAMFHFPKLLRTLDNIQREVFSKLSMPAGNYESFASAVENLFLDPALIALDEYGLPLEIAKKLDGRLRANGDLDSVLKSLKTIDPDEFKLTEFEREILADVQSHI